MADLRAAINEALAEEMERDEHVLVIGEDVAAAGGVFKVTAGLWERFGAERVIDTPISELALSGIAFGSAVAGRRPVVEIMFGDFLALAMDALINQAAKYWYLSGERRSVPLVIRTAVGAGGQFGPIHSQTPGTWLHGIPGIKVVCPATPAAAKALLKAAIRDANPVVFMEHKRLYALKGELGPAASIGSLGTARIAKEGSDVTLVSVMKGVHDALDAAETLAQHGVDAEVVDLQALRPLDTATVLSSVAKTGRLVAIEEGPRTGGWAAGLAGALAADGLDVLDDIAIVTTPDGPVPFSPPLESAFLPGPDDIVAEVLQRLSLEA